MKPTPSLWASWKPFGIGETRPNNYGEVFRAVWENRRRPRYAWRILTRGICDGCALGTSGLHDWTIDGVHVCNVRLRLLRLNTMTAFDHELLEDVAPLRRERSQHLRELGRLPRPMVRRAGERGFSPISWEQALDFVADRMRAAGPERCATYLTSRGMPNESYYAVQKAMRALGTNNVDNAARVCHSPSTFALKEAIGVGATTCSYTDMIGSDLLVFIGSNPANNQPVTMKYLHLARKAGTRIVCVNPYREPGMERYWVPSTVESAVFGTKMAERFYEIDTGGDVPFFSGVLKHMVERGWIEREFVERHTTGFDELGEKLTSLGWEELEAGAGVPREEMLDLARRLHEARTGVLVWSMGVTQQAVGEDNVRAIVNLGLAKGWVGKEKCGLMPIRGHSGVQGGAEMGCYATNFPGGGAVNEEGARELAGRWGFEVPSEPGLTALEMVDAAGEGRLDVLVSAGGNFLEVLPEPQRVERALARVPLRVHMDIVLSPQMLVDPADTVILLPAVTRYEIPGGVTETSTERRVIFSPEIPGPRVKEARAEWWVLGELAARARPERAEAVRFDGTPSIREEIARVIPSYAGIDELRETGDQFQYGGPLLCEGWHFETDDGKAHFQPVEPTRYAPPEEGMLRLATRRGKQFNSMLYAHHDRLTGAERDVVMLAAQDAARLGLENGDEVVLRSECGELRGRARLAPMKPGNVQVHWPEGNVLIASERRSPDAKIPDYTAWVKVESGGAL